MPFLVFAASIVLLYGAAWAGVFLRRWPLADTRRRDFGVILGASLTLLGIIIGFTFSMASNRYELRKSYEAAEANAIGTEYVRADLLPAANAAEVKALLKTFLSERIAFYASRDDRQLRRIGTYTSELETKLWRAVRDPAVQTPTALAALAVAGINDVLNGEAYTLAAWRNRIPTAPWVFMAVIAVCCNILIGYSSAPARGQFSFFLILPFVAAIAFMLIADLDSPRGGFIQVVPQNLVSLSEALRR